MQRDRLHYIRGAMSRLPRRRFLRTVAATPALTIIGCQRRGRLSSRSCAEKQRSARTGRVLSPEEWLTLEAACSRIIPTDGEPGAKEAGVVNYIDAQLSLSHFQVFQRVFSAGLRQLDLLAKKQGEKLFRECTVQVQDRILKQMEQGVPIGQRRSSKQFFRLLLTFTLEGFLCDPVYGGNRNMVGWKLIGFEPRPPRPRCPYRGRG